MTNRRFRSKAAGLKGLMLAVVFGCSLASPALAASHREAPKIALDPAADITDVYFFRSWEDSGKVVLIMNVIPGQEPSSGPNYFNFDDDVLYVIHVDTDRDGKEDIDYEFRFRTEIRPPFDDLPVSYAGVDRAGLRRRSLLSTAQVRRGWDCGRPTRSGKSGGDGRTTSARRRCSPFPPTSARGRCRITKPWQPRESTR